MLLQKRTKRAGGSLRETRLHSHIIWSEKQNNTFPIASRLRCIGGEYLHLDFQTRCSSLTAPAAHTRIWAINFVLYNHAAAQRTWRRGCGMVGTCTQKSCACSNNACLACARSLTPPNAPLSLPGSLLLCDTAFIAPSYCGRTGRT